MSRVFSLIFSSRKNSGNSHKWQNEKEEGTRRSKHTHFLLDTNTRQTSGNLCELWKEKHVGFSREEKRVRVCVVKNT